MSAVTDEDLLARQAALHEQGRQLLARLNLDALVADVGPLLVTGSFVSGLMSWHEVDVMVLAGRDFSPRDVMGLMARVVDRWQIDLTLWLHDLHRNVMRWHEELRERITAEERLAVLRIKDHWHRQPAYPDQVGGLDVYTAVMDDGIRTRAEFAAWLDQRGQGDAG
jgi:hypothetical protein